MRKLLYIPHKIPSAIYGFTLLLAALLSVECTAQTTTQQYTETDSVIYSGKILNDNKQPLADILVTVKQEGEAIGAAITDEKGNYCAVTHPKNGEVCMIEARYPGYLLSVVTSIPTTTGSIQGIQLQLLPSNKAEDYNKKCACPSMTGNGIGVQKKFDAKELTQPAN